MFQCYWTIRQALLKEFTGPFTLDNPQTSLQAVFIETTILTTEIVPQTNSIHPHCIGVVAEVEVNILISRQGGCQQVATNKVPRAIDIKDC